MTSNHDCTADHGDREIVNTAPRELVCKNLISRYSLSLNFELLGAYYMSDLFIMLSAMLPAVTQLRPASLEM